MPPERIVILGAAGRDFHNFNLLYRGRRRQAEVVAFTAAQIPNIAGRAYPPELAGPGYPKGIPIVPESTLRELLQRERIDRVLLAYSDLPHEEVMHKASIALAGGASFELAGPRATELVSSRPVIAVGAVRTGSGKSPLTRYLARRLRERGFRIAIVRHPMPYGDLVRQAVQRFAELADLDAADCTIEEREEYEPHLREGAVVFAGVDYERILRAAEREADVLLWDGGNNDLPFFAPDLYYVVADPWRAGHELLYHPGEANLRSADVVVVSKSDSAPPDQVSLVESNAARVNPSAEIVRGALTLSVEAPERLRGRRVLVVEDGPTVTHGGLDTGAATLVAERYGATIVEARPFAVGSIASVYDGYRHLRRVLPAMGYSPEQVRDLAATIDASGVDLVLDGSPIDLARLLKVRTPIVRVGYEFDDLDGKVAARLDRFLAGRRPGRAAPAGPSGGRGRRAAPPPRRARAPPRRGSPGRRRSR